MKQKLNYLKEFEWILFTKQKIRPLNEKLKFSVCKKTNAKLNIIFYNKLKDSSFS
jgi:hypothetical protein